MIQPRKIFIYVWYDLLKLQKVFYNLLLEIFLWTVKGEEIRLSCINKKKYVDILIKTPGSALDLFSYELISGLINGSVPDDKIFILGDRETCLTICKNIILLHKGEFCISREDGMITLIIKLKNGREHFAEQWINVKEKVISLPSFFKEPDLLLFDGTSESIDEEVIQKQFKMLLVGSDNLEGNLLKDVFSLMYQVIGYADGVKAYQYAVKEMPDIIICSVDLLGMSGIELCQKLKSNINMLHIPIILTTIRPSEEQKKECVRCGAEDYMVQPFDIDILFLRCNVLVQASKKIQGKYLDSKLQNVEQVTNQQDLKFMEIANRILEENYNNSSFDTSYWSHDIGISRTRLFTRIKEITGMTPNDYILVKKMDKAMSLFKEKPFRSVADVAYMLGFSNPAYFSKCFKKQFGITPLDYKKQF